LHDIPHLSQKMTLAGITGDAGFSNKVKNYRAIIMPEEG
jgi:hypothetical protein